MFYIYLFLYSYISDTKITFLLILQSVYLTGKFLEIIGLNDTHAHVHRTPFNRTYVSQLVSHLYGEKVYGFTARCSWHCGGHCATIVGRVQRWWVADNRKSSDGNGRKETKKGGRKVREIGTSSDLGSKRKSGRECTRMEMSSSMDFSLTTMKWKQEFDLSHHFLLFH